MEVAPAHLAVLEERLGYRFRQTELLQAALTHPSFRHEHPGAGADNQRLEFLGDAVLSFLLAEPFFQEQPEADEGALTVLRSRCSNGRVLAEIARGLSRSTSACDWAAAPRGGGKCPSRKPGRAPDRIPVHTVRNRNFRALCISICAAYGAYSITILHPPYKGRESTAGGGGPSPPRRYRRGVITVPVRRGYSRCLRGRVGRSDHRYPTSIP